MSRWSTQRDTAQHLPGTILPGVPLAQFVPSQPSRVVDASAAAIEAELVQLADPTLDAFDEIVQHPTGGPAPIVEAELVAAGPLKEAAAVPQPRVPASAAVEGPWSAPWPATIPAWGQAPKGFGQALAQLPAVGSPGTGHAAPNPHDLVGHAVAS
jgi:hypothetical protein